MALPTNMTGTPTGLTKQGVTTIVWGTDGLWSSYIVSRISQKQLIENVKLTNGTGITVTRVQLTDGVQWDITVRDDTGMTAPVAGNTFTAIYDAAGMLGTVGLTYTGRIVESSWDTSSKQAAERSITVEKLTLITES
tara:strand:+ start:14883 stop:15293 length:411 start_codon:yes stop_codon:yes gene_type:complete